MSEADVTGVGDRDHAGGAGGDAVAASSDDTRQAAAIADELIGADVARNGDVAARRDGRCVGRTADIAHAQALAYAEAVGVGTEGAGDDGDLAPVLCGGRCGGECQGGTKHPTSSKSSHAHRLSD